MKKRQIRVIHIGKRNNTMESDKEPKKTGNKKLLVITAAIAVAVNIVAAAVIFSIGSGTEKRPAENAVLTEGDHVMDWKNADLEKAMRDITGITDRDIMLSDVQGYMGFDLSYEGISDISVLSGLTNLKSLSLNGNHISDISALSGLTNLEWLDLSGNNISDISALSGLTNLEWLALDGNNISDISALSGLTNLKTLCLETNNISDISALSGLTNLQELYLYGNPVTDYEQVSFVPVRDY